MQSVSWSLVILVCSSFRRSKTLVLVILCFYRRFVYIFKVTSWLFSPLRLKLSSPFPATFMRLLSFHLSAPSFLPLSHHVSPFSSLIHLHESSWLANGVLCVFRTPGRRGSSRTQWYSRRRVTKKRTNSHYLQRR